MIDLENKPNDYEEMRLMCWNGTHPEDVTLGAVYEIHGNDSTGKYFIDDDGASCSALLGTWIDPDKMGLPGANLQDGVYKLISWDGQGLDVSVGKIYTVIDGDYDDDVGDLRRANIGVWELLDVVKGSRNLPDGDYRLVSWNGDSKGLSMGGEYTIFHGSFMDTLLEERRAVHGTWVLMTLHEPVDIKIPPKKKVGKIDQNGLYRVTRWNGDSGGVTIGGSYGIFDGTFTDDKGDKRLSNYGVWDLLKRFLDSGLPDTPPELPVRDHNVGDSDYAEHVIQVWDIWKEYNLNAFDADIVKRVLRKKATDSRKMDYEKIIHVCQERIRQIDEERNTL